jgi:hypothetical protein
MEEIVRLLADRRAVVDTLVKLFVSTDERDWESVAGCFADRVLFDMTSLAGGEPASLSPAQITSGWAAGLEPLEAVHHQAGNFRVEVEGDEATASCYATASHYRKVPSGRNTRTLVGSYDFHLAREDGSWRIDLFRFNLKYLDGNLELDHEDPEG